MLSSLEKSILKSIVYFDILSYPLKEKELLWNLANTFDVTSRDYFLSVSLGEMIKKSQYLQEVIRNNNGFYFLKGREELIEERKEKERISEQNWKKLKKITPIINWTPFLKGVFVSGSLAINNSNKSSDIDLMIIAEKGRIFTVRFFLTLFLSIIRERRTPHKIAGKICLNHYLADNALRVNFPSVYNAYTYLHLKPIISREGVFERFRKEQDWMKDYILFWDKIFKPPFQIEKKSKTAVILEKKLSGSLGDTIEEKLKNIQLKRKEKNYPQGIKNGRVILNDYLIELHPDSPEKEILKRYQKKLKKLLFLR